MVGLTGLEPVTPALSRQCSNQLSYRPFTLIVLNETGIVSSMIRATFSMINALGGGMGIRTPDIQLAKLALYQLSYTP